MSGLAFIDTETTGLDPERNPVWEIAVILPDGPHEGEHCWQVQVPPLVTVTDADPAPMRPYVSTWVLENTGFGERYDKAAALSRFDAIVKFAQLVEGRHLVGAVPSFDEERLRAMYRAELDRFATRFPWHYHLIDVEALAVGYLAGIDKVVSTEVAITPPWKSDDLSRAIGIEPPSPAERHTALADARWARAIYEAVTG